MINFLYFRIAKPIHSKLFTVVSIIIVILIILNDIFMIKRFWTRELIHLFLWSSSFLFSIQLAREICIWSSKSLGCFLLSLLLCLVLFFVSLPLVYLCNFCQKEKLWYKIKNLYRKKLIHLVRQDLNHIFNNKRLFPM